MLPTALFTAGELALSKITHCNILLAEDSPFNAKLFSILFEQVGVQLHFAENGKEAVEKVRKNKFDIVLMDIEMPVMDGYEATTIIRQQLQSTIPIIALTAHTRPGEKEKCLQAGMNAYLLKPADDQLLFSTIHNLVYPGAADLLNAATEITGQTIVAEKICNLSYLINTTRGNKVMQHNIIQLFMQQIPKQLTELNEAIEKIKYTAICNSIHKLKSSIAVMGIDRLKPVLDEMEQLGSITSGIEKIKQLNCKVANLFKSVIEEMKPQLAINEMHALSV